MTNDYAKKERELRLYMKTKYGDSYLSAISKLNVSNPYDDKGILKPEYALSPKEKEALLYYIPETKQFLGQQSTTESLQDTFDQKYQQFLSDVRKTTAEIVSNSQPSEGNVDIPWEIVGIEFLSWEVEEKYGKDIYKKACEEVPYENDGVHRMFHRDFSKANIKLGHIIHEGVSASPLMDLDYFTKLLEKKGIPSYIDFETNTFHYNGIPEKGKTM